MIKILFSLEYPVFLLFSVFFNYQNQVAVGRSAKIHPVGAIVVQNII